MFETGCGLECLGHKPQQTAAIHSQPRCQIPLECLGNKPQQQRSTASRDVEHRRPPCGVVLRSKRPSLAGKHGRITGGVVPGCSLCGYRSEVIERQEQTAFTAAVSLLATRRLFEKLTALRNRDTPGRGRSAGAMIQHIYRDNSSRRADPRHCPRACPL